MAKFYLDPCIEQELFGIWRFIAHDNPGAADRVIAAAYDTFKTLSENPMIGRKRRFRGLRLRTLRSWRMTGFEAYLIFYRPVPGGVQIQHIYHGAQNLDSLLGD